MHGGRGDEALQGCTGSHAGKLGWSSGSFRWDGGRPDSGQMMQVSHDGSMEIKQLTTPLNTKFNPKKDWSNISFISDTAY
jgi:hypothetical protein